MVIINFEEFTIPLSGILYSQWQLKQTRYSIYVIRLISKDEIIMTIHDNKLTESQKIVYEWVKINPWHKRMHASEAIMKKYGLSWRQAFNAHISITRKGFLQKQKASMNTVYAISTFSEVPAALEQERQHFLSWLKNEHGIYGKEVIWHSDKNRFAVFSVNLSWCAWQARSEVKNKHKQ
ncbi:TPA: hypothetical protein KE814_001692 [Citrobacter freundii]|nr:hypothetical protein [Citrobacter freundii]